LPHTLKRYGVEAVKRSMENKEKSIFSIGFGGLLTLIFITLKLVDKIDWSWWWVLSPLWIPVALILFLVLIVILFSERD
jgi:energy-coupling factor transporter transmembrane protein EcfT